MTEFVGDNPQQCSSLSNRGCGLALLWGVPVLYCRALQNTSLPDLLCLPVKIHRC